MKLFASLTSPYARKVRVILAEKNLSFDLIGDSPWEQGSQIQAVNPLGKVPALESDEGEAFFDSPVIAAYLETLDVPPSLIPKDPLEAVRVRKLEALADGIVDAAVTAYLEGRRPEGKRSDEIIERQMGKVEHGLDHLDGVVTGRHWLHGNNMGLADIATGVMLGFLDLRMPDFDWRSGRPSLTALSERLFVLPSFRDTVAPAG